jgi:hypothetical protein
MDDQAERPPIEEKINQAEKLAGKQQERLDNMSPEERKAWGFETPDAVTQGKKDEEKNPSLPAKIDE